MAYYTQQEMLDIGFRKIGKNVKISTKASIYNAEKISIGDNSRVDDFCLLSGKIAIGKNIHITPYCNLAGGEMGITIADYATLAYGVNAFTQSDDYSGKTMTNSTIPEKYKNEIKKAIHIGKYAIVGAGSYIMPGVKIGEGCSIGAMSLVNKSTEPWRIYFGVPAKDNGKKSKDLLNLANKYKLSKHYCK